MQVSCSVGIAVYPEDGTDLDELMRRADAAMYEAKAAGRDMARMFVPEIDQLAARTPGRWSSACAWRWRAARWSLHYQPRLRAGSMAVVAWRALLRWHSAELGPVEPARFIPVAEETGQIRELGLWVMHEACGQLARWQAAGLRDLHLSINLSAAHWPTRAWWASCAVACRNTGATPGLLELEITESHLMGDAIAAEDKLAALKGLGLRLSVDDFGTGYSSLAYLKRFPIDKLKIDQSFVRDMLTDPTDLAIIRAIIALGHTLGLGRGGRGCGKRRAGAAIAAPGLRRTAGLPRGAAHASAGAGALAAAVAW